MSFEKAESDIDRDTRQEIKEGLAELLAESRPPSSPGAGDGPAEVFLIRFKDGDDEWDAGTLHLSADKASAFAESCQGYAADPGETGQGDRITFDSFKVLRYVPEVPASPSRAEPVGGWVAELAAWKRLASSIVEAEEAGDVTFRECQWSSEWSAEFYRLARRLPAPPAPKGEQR